MRAEEWTPPLCERCWGPVLDGQRFAMLGHIRHADLRGNVEWSYTWVHAYADGGCDTSGAAAAGSVAA